MSVMGGGMANWTTGASQLIYTAPQNINGMLITRVIGRSYTGSQPLSAQLKVNGVNWGSTITLITPTSNAAFVLPMPSGVTPVLGAGQNMEVVPLLPASGTMMFDVNGYFF